MGRSLSIAPASRVCDATNRRHRALPFSRDDGPMPDTGQLRDLAARMLVLALGAKDQHLLEWLVIRASDYLEQATELEAAAQSTAVQQAQQPQPDKKA
jgi:hypothetical protein